MQVSGWNSSLEVSFANQIYNTRREDQDEPSRYQARLILCLLYISGAKKVFAFSLLFLLVQIFLRFLFVSRSFFFSRHQA